jgi:hypothetical protein
MSAELGITLILAAMYGLVVIGPLVPAVVTYKLFPDTSVGLSGPLQGMTVRATGAFAAYTIVFLLMLPLTNKIFDVVGGFLKPSWTIYAELKPVDRNNKEVTAANFLESATVALKPEINTLASRSLRMSIPGVDPDNWPHVTVHVPGWGAGEIDLGRLRSDAEWDRFRKTVRLRAPIVVREYEGASVPYAASQPYLKPEGNGP